MRAGANTLQEGKEADSKKSEKFGMTNVRNSSFIGTMIDGNHFKFSTDQIKKYQEY